ncbi:hypothetical protein ANS017_18180 [Paraclostridium bifermentans]|nr:hypothetical protein ANS014_15490 [Paraclostridium bifermentans]GKZ05720.1 hypothetical protein ANS015_06030 [Paraclostridium bifermentans]GKZ10434.1 hypothetical protein ANS017_18180 [Paraclostridium bifermentans]
MLLKDREYEVDVVDIGQGGVGIGKHDGFTVFVDGGLISDKLKVKITKSKKKLCSWRNSRNNRKISI